MSISSSEIKRFTIPSTPVLQQILKNYGKTCTIQLNSSSNEKVNTIYLPLNSLVNNRSLGKPPVNILPASTMVGATTANRNSSTSMTTTLPITLDKSQDIFQPSRLSEKVQERLTSLDSTEGTDASTGHHVGKLVWTREMDKELCKLILSNSPFGYKKGSMTRGAIWDKVGHALEKDEKFLNSVVTGRAVRSRLNGLQKRFRNRCLPKESLEPELYQLLREVCKLEDNSSTEQLMARDKRRAIVKVVHKRPLEAENNNKPAKKCKCDVSLLTKKFELELEYRERELKLKEAEFEKNQIYLNKHQEENLKVFENIAKQQVHFLNQVSQQFQGFFSEMQKQQEQLLTSFLETQKNLTDSIVSILKKDQIHKES